MLVVLNHVYMDTGQSTEKTVIAVHKIKACLIL